MPLRAGNDGTRRWHNKTRSGCAQCKERRIKCDERRPSCKNCERASRVCIFLVRPTKSLAHQPSRAVSSTGLDLQEGEWELLHHYYTTTCDSMACNTQYTQWLKEQAPTYGFTNVYSRKAMLAYAAAHLARTVPHSRNQYDKLGARLRTQAMMEASTVLSRVQGEDCGPLFVCTLFLGCASMAAADFEIKGGRMTPVQILTAAGRALAGCAPLHQKYAELTGRWGGPFIPPKAFFNGEELDRNFDIDQSCSDLSDFARESTAFAAASNDPNSQLFFDAIYALRQCVLAYEEHRDGALMINFLCNTRLLELTEERDPVAEAIMMFYGVFLHRFSNLWWSGNLGEPLVQQLASDLSKNSNDGARLAASALNCLNWSRKAENAMEGVSYTQKQIQ